MSSQRRTRNDTAGQGIWERVEKDSASYGNETAGKEIRRTVLLSGCDGK